MARYAPAGDMLGELSRNWWVVILRGLIVALLGLVVVVWVQALPEETALVVMAVVFGLLALADGLALGWVALRSGTGVRVSLLVRAILGVLLGVLAIVVPLLVGIALIYVVGVWAVVTGIAEIITAIRLRANISSEWLLVFAGSLSVVFGLLLWFWPLEAARVIAFVIGVYAIILGAVIATAGLRLRGAADLLAPEYDSEYEGRDEEGSTPKGESDTERRGPARRRGRHRAPKDGRS